MEYLFSCLSSRIFHRGSDFTTVRNSHENYIRESRGYNAGKSRVRGEFRTKNATPSRPDFKTEPLFIGGIVFTNKRRTPYTASSS